jgi:mono/diheme cytochrome c family protein
MKREQLVTVLLLALAIAVPAQALRRQQDTGTAPDDIREQANPVEAGPESLRAGRILWEKHCLTCHGEAGRGDGPNARLHEARKKVAPRDLTAAQFQENVSDGEIFWRVSKGLVEAGEVLMPPYEEMIPSEAQRWQLVHYVRSLRTAGS